MRWIWSNAKPCSIARGKQTPNTTHSPCPEAALSHLSSEALCEGWIREDSCDSWTTISTILLKLSKSPLKLLRVGGSIVPGKLVFHVADTLTLDRVGDNNTGFFGSKGNSRKRLA